MRFLRRPKEQDLDDEIQAHLAIETKQRIERGEAPEEAALSARRDVGSVAVAMEEGGVAGPEKITPRRG